MNGKRGVSFQFKNQVAPRYIKPLFMQLEYGHWYETAELRALLRAGGLNVVGKDIVLANVQFWSKLGLGRVKREGSQKLFQLSILGRQLSGLYSTNQALFFDVMHFLFYSSWFRTGKLDHAPFWLYAQICDRLWGDAPSDIDSHSLVAWLQAESRHAFPAEAPQFPGRSVQSVFPWLQSLTPPFLQKVGRRSVLQSRHRHYCTPQLFHLAVDLVYKASNLNYDTSLAMDEAKIVAISRVCLLSPDRFWDMASLTDMAIRELEVRKGQWATSLALTGPPRWIELPDYRSAEG